MFRLFAITGLVALLPADGVVRIRANLGDDSAFVGGITLTSPTPVPDLIFRSSDLERVNGIERIRGQSVSLAGVQRIALAANEPRDLDVKVSNVKLPGTYKGTLYFVLPSQTVKDALAVPIEVTAVSIPKLMQRKGSEAVKIQLVNCWMLGCGVARLLQPSAFTNMVPVVLDNASHDAFDISVSLTATGDTTRSSIGDVVKVAERARVEPRPTFTLPIVVNDGSPSRPLPDHYVGDVQLRTSGPDALIKIPLEVNVRTGPMWPLICVLGGILLGRLAKYMNDRGNAQADLMSRFYRLEAEAATADHAVFDPMLKEARALIYDMRLAEATAVLDKVKTLLTNTVVLPPGVAYDDSTDPVAPPAPAAGRGRWLQWLAAVRAESTFWLARPLLYLLLIVSLTIVGLLQLYVKNTTFGSDPVSDYFGLLIWAMSSDVASRSLANLRM